MTFFKICMILWATLVLSFAFHIKSDSKSRHIHQKQQSSIIPKQHQKQDNFHQTKYFKSTSSSIHAKFQDVDVVSTEDESEYKSDLVKSSLLVGAAMAFAGGIAMLKGQPSAVEFLSGYLLELCLSVDNLIVFILLFDSFQVKKVDQTRVLNYGILGAVLLRGIFILAGSVAIDNFKQVLLLFAGILLYSSYQVLFQGEEEEEDISKNPAVIFAKKYLRTSDQFDGSNFFTLIDGVKYATPLLLCLVCVELTDILFAFDSVPAIFGVTNDPLIVYSSNIFAILGLRSLFGVLSTAVDKLKYLDKAVGVVLAVIAAKLGAEPFGIELLTPLQSLAVVLGVLGTGVAASLLINPDANEEEIS